MSRRITTLGALYALAMPTLAVVHLVSSFPAALGAVYAPDMSLGGQWLASAILWAWFFPCLLLDLAGIRQATPADILDLPVLVINSSVWAAVVLPVWLVSCRARGRRSLTRAALVLRRFALIQQARLRGR
jgi:hypothetical protein